MNGQFDGMGMLIYKGGITFIGNFKQGLREGEGRI